MNIPESVASFFTPPGLPVEGFGRHQSWIVELIEGPWKLCFWEGYWKGSLVTGLVMVVLYLIVEHVRKRKVANGG